MSAFAKACPLYISYGMTYDQFWDGDVCAHKAYREAHKMQMRERNQFAHIQAAYVYEALCASSSLFRGMKPSKPQSFRKDPFDIFPEDVRKREEEEQRQRYEKMRDKVAAFAKAFNEKRKEREVDSNAGCEP